MVVVGVRRFRRLLLTAGYTPFLLDFSFTLLLDGLTFVKAGSDYNVLFEKLIQPVSLGGSVFSLIVGISVFEMNLVVGLISIHIK